MTRSLGAETRQRATHPLPSEERSRCGGARAKLLIFMLGVAFAGSAIVLRPMLRAHSLQQVESLLAAAQTAFEIGDLSTTLDLTENAVRKSYRSPELLARSLLMMGVARVEKAERVRTGNVQSLLAAAAQNLTEAAQAGVRPGDLPKLNHYLGRCWYGQSLHRESLPLLEQSLQDYPAGRRVALRLLAAAYMEPPRNDLERARWLNSELLRIPGLTPDEIVEAWATRNQIVRRLGTADLLMDIELAAGRGELSWVATLIEAYEAFEDLRHDITIERCSELLRSKTLPEPLVRRIWFLLGLAARDKGEDELALDTFRRLEWRYPNTSEARSAAAHSGAVLLRQQNLDAAIAALGRAVSSSAADDRSTLLGGLTLTRVIATAVERLREQNQFEAALDLIEAMRPLANEAAVDRAAARLYETWAKHKLEQAKSLNAIDAEQTRYQAAELFRSAGTVLVRVADRSNSSSDAAQVLWHAAQNLVLGEHYAAAIDALERMLSGGTAGELEPNALALASAAQEAAGQLERVHEFAEPCIARHAQHPAAVKARYHLAKAQIGLRQLTEAEHNLRAILQSPSSLADPAIAQRTRLILAHLLNDQAREEEAIPLINDLLAAPADETDRLDARLLAAECLRRRARRPATRLAESQGAQAKAHYRQQRSTILEQSLQILTALQHDLAALERKGYLTNRHAEWLRKCRWSIADCLYELEQYAEAIELYKQIAETYTEPADWLLAHMQIANCHVCLNELSQAHATLRAAQARLEKAPEAAEQAEIGMTPARWKEWVDWTRQL